MPTIRSIFGNDRDRRLRSDDNEAETGQDDIEWDVHGFGVTGTLGITTERVWHYSMPLAPIILSPAAYLATLPIYLFTQPILSLVAMPFYPLILFPMTNEDGDLCSPTIDLPGIWVPAMCTDLGNWDFGLPRHFGVDINDLEVEVKVRASGVVL